ncbi:alpha-hydroxy-acid oxidizing enzyme [Sphingobium sp. LB126]|uniref:alpha-hydroxy acid oxidase n=1 Tax=Sphingobium sp. LB126 TaxID=1983755 RepID=UPI000C206E8F|nr:alpha-hydroxy acid oxidase [Sphingobium sp. LB126]PJG46398.1 alpha-hydroxy-acid oxidizing enzyme [Sphingobium sp. LB126]
MSRWHNIEALKGSARSALPRPIFDYLDGGAEDELALRRSSSAFDRYELLPRMLVDVSHTSTETEIFGRRIPFPLMLAPTGLTRLFHRDAELAVARAASAAGVPYCLSTLGTTTIEEFGRALSAPKLFQIYIFKDRGLTEEFIERARAEGYDGLVLTVDTLVAGKRERDIVNGLSLPPRLTPRGFWGFAMRPSWSIPALFGRKFDFVNVAHRVAALSGDPISLQDYVSGQFDRSLTWKDVEWLAARWGGPLAVKGILRLDDAKKAADAGVDTVMVSNHGGRQLESAAAPIDQVAVIADGLGGRMKIICDGGIRRGSHIFKALALGADAVSIGRPYLYGLAAGGSRGVERAISLLREEFERCMILGGANSLGDLNREMIRPSASTS